MRNLVKKAWSLCLTGVCAAAPVAVSLNAPASAQDAKAATSPESSPRAAQVEQYLIDGHLAAGQKVLAERLARNPGDDEARYELGFLQFLRAVEALSQELYHYGFASPERLRWQPRVEPRPLRTAADRNAPETATERDMPETAADRDRLEAAEREHHLRHIESRWPFPVNRNPQTISYQAARDIVKHFQTNLLSAERTLSGIKSDKVHLPLHFGMIKMDLNGDGRTDQCETFWRIFANMSNATSISASQASEFYIDFDRGDVHWLRGYCHLASAVCDMYLAYDSREFFVRTAHILFDKVDSPYLFLGRSRSFDDAFNSGFSWLDIVALIHLINWELVEPARMPQALRHFEEVVAQSRVSWKYILAEKDDSHEWLPNPNQHGVLPRMQVTAEMVQSWSALMDESERVLQGKLLIPFWRGDDVSGINLRKVFTQPRRFDLVLWVQGSEALPYLEKGPMTKLATWRSFTRAFNRNFPGFAIYFN